MNYPKKATLLSTRSSNMTQTLVAAREVKKESHLKAGCQPRQQTCVSSEVNTLNMHEHGNTPGSTSSQWKQRKHRKPNKLQCMMHSHNRHSRTLSFDLFTFINSPRPPLAALYTTRINNSTRAWQQFGEEGCQCVCVGGGDYPAFQDVVSPDDQEKTLSSASTMLAWISRQTHWRAFCQCDRESTVKSRHKDLVGLWSLTSYPVQKCLSTHEHKSTCGWPRPWTENLSAKIS